MHPRAYLERLTIAIVALESLLMLHGAADGWQSANDCIRRARTNLIGARKDDSAGNGRQAASADSPGAENLS